MNLIPEIWPQQAGPHPAVSQQADQHLRTGNIRKACLNGSINPINLLHMHPCGLGLKPASVIIVLWYCHYSIYPPPTASTSIPSPEEKMFKSLSIQNRRKKERIFSQGMELEDVLSGAEHCVLTGGHAHDEKQSCSVNWWEIRLPIVADFKKIFDWRLSSHLTRGEWKM